MKTETKESLGGAILIAVLVGVCLVIVFGCLFGWKAYSRYQKVQDTKNFVKTSQMRAKNQTILNEIQISQTQQLIEVEQQKAQIRIQEAKGIAAAMDLIQAKLTPLYLQHEAIQAQTKMAQSQNHTQVYIPTGDNGIPLVRTTDP